MEGRLRPAQPMPMVRASRWPLSSQCGVVVTLPAQGVSTINDVRDGNAAPAHRAYGADARPGGTRHGRRDAASRRAAAVASRHGCVALTHGGRRAGAPRGRLEQCGAGVDDDDAAHPSGASLRVSLQAPPVGTSQFPGACLPRTAWPLHTRGLTDTCDFICIVRTRHNSCRTVPLTARGERIWSLETLTRRRLTAAEAATGHAGDGRTLVPGG